MGIKVLFCFRSTLLAHGLAALLSEDRQMDCLGNAKSKSDLERLLSAASPEVVVADEASLDDLLSRRETPILNVILISNTSSRSHAAGDLQDWLANGLAGILGTEANADQLRKAVRAVHAGQLWVDHKILRSSICRSAHPAQEVALTRREKQILACLCQGCSNKEIATRLFISQQTVKSHCNSLYRKFSVCGRLKLVALAREIIPDGVAALQRPLPA